MRVLLPSLVLVLSSVNILLADNPPANPPPKAPGLGNPGKLTAIQIDTGPLKDGAFVLAGRDAARQLVVNGQFDSGQVRDLTRNVTYEVQPAGIVAVDSTGYVIPLQEGQATVSVKTAEGLQSGVNVVVTHFAQDLPINFANQIVPIFTKHGCNGGGCHGKSGGQNGFRLSLLGFEPTEDYEYLVKEGRMRRLFPAAPDRSLLLQKASAVLPHGGGQRIELGSPAYKLLRRWVEQGMPYGNQTDPTVTHIDVFPGERLMERDGTQQIAVIAYFTDGSAQDVTRMTQFDSNDSEMAEVAVTGLVKTAQLTGSVAIMARYQGHVGVFRATVPLGLQVANLPPVQNFIDEQVFAKLKSLGLPASNICDDVTFLRRVSRLKDKRQYS